MSRIVSDYYRCQTCATPLPSVVPNHECHRCLRDKWHIDRVLTLGPYRDDLREIAIAMKKTRSDLLRTAIAKRMSHLLVESGEISSGAPRDTWVVPVPNHWTHNWSGAANTAGELAATIARRTGIPLNTRLARRIRKTGKQGMLSWSDRVRNVRGAFQICRPSDVSECHVILVDDVLTSGATCAEIAKQLKRAGCWRVTVLIAARGVGAKETVLQTTPDTNPVPQV